MWKGRGCILVISVLKVLLRSFCDCVVYCLADLEVFGLSCGKSLHNKLMV